MQNLIDYLADFERDLGISEDKDEQQDRTAAVSAAVTPAVNADRSKPKPTAPVKAVDIELEKAKAEYKKTEKLYKQRHNAKIKKQLAILKEIYEFSKTYHERKQPLIEQTKGLFKVLHPIKARQAQKELDEIRQKNFDNMRYLDIAVPYKIEWEIAELIREEGINKVYDLEMSLENLEYAIRSISADIDHPKYPLAVNLLNPKSNAADYESAARALREYLE